MDLNCIDENTFIAKEIKTVSYRKKMITHKITSSDDIYKYLVKLRNSLNHDDFVESFYIFVLSRANNIIGWKRISQGGTTGTVVDIKLIAKFATNLLGCSIILAHNHPSGNINPSNSDKQITEKIKNGMNFLEIQLLDHIIISEEEPFQTYFSFADEGIL